MESCASLYTRIRAKGFSPSKKKGQNFLVDDNVRGIVLECARVEGEKVLEVGPGNGALTVGLLEGGAEVWGIELDPWLCAFLKCYFGKKTLFHLIEGHALKISIENLPPKKIVANLPYNITSPLLYRFWDLEERFPEMVLMVQWEVAQRLTASPGTRDYSLLTVLFATSYEVKMVHRVPRNCFRPIPEVDSAVVKITWKGKKLGPLKEGFKGILEAGFQHRRKTLANSLKLTLPGRAWEGLLKGLGFPSQVRAQELSPSQWVALTRESKIRGWLP